MTIEELQERLRAIQTGTGLDGYLTVTIEQALRPTWSVSHWLPRSGPETEACEVLASGSLAACLRAAERYADGRRRRHSRAGRKPRKDSMDSCAAGRQSGLSVRDLQARLRGAHADIGFRGRLSFTIPQGADAACYVAHWIRPTVVAFEDCRAIGAGSVSECLAALERYVAEYRDRFLQGNAPALRAAWPGLSHHYRSAAE